MVTKGKGQRGGARSALGVSAILALVASTASASSFTFIGSSGTLAASAEFDVIGADLVVTLSNTSSSDVLAPADVLTALFFDVVGFAPLNLTPDKAVLGDSAVVLFGPQPAGGVVGGEWTYESGLIGAPDNLAYGISSAGFGVFSSSGKFPGDNLQGPVAANGLQYGLVSTGDHATTGNAAVTGLQHLIKDSVVFTLGGIPIGFDPETHIKDVVFQYGTSLGEPAIKVPEPASLMLMGLGALAILRRVRGRP